MTPEQYKILFGDGTGTAPAKERHATVVSRARDFALAFPVRRKRERIAIVAGLAFIVVGLFAASDLNKTIEPTEANAIESTGFVAALSVDSLSREVANSSVVSPAPTTPTTTIADAEVLGVVVAGDTPTTVRPAPASTVAVAATTELAPQPTFAEIGGDGDQVSLSVNAEQPEGNCHPNYEPCVPDVNYGLSCDDLTFSVRIVGDADPYQLDGETVDGFGCEGNEGP